MLTAQELLQFCEEFKFSKKTVAEIRRIRSQERGGRSARGNFIGRYPSRKMTTILQLEGRRLELPCIKQIERDNKALELYDQPSTQTTLHPPKGRTWHRSMQGH